MVEVVRSVRVVSNISRAASSIATVADTANKAIPEMKVMVQSVCNSAAFSARFVAIVSAAEIAGNLVLGHQGERALASHCCSP